MHRALTRKRAEAYNDEGSTGWRYVMLSREESRIILRRIVDGPRPGTTLAVWEAARSYAEWNTGRIAASVQELSDASGAPPGEVYRALSHLVELGGLVRTGRGRYALNPQVGWSGSLARRQARLEVVD